ncbi:DUF4012 domain-containing protein [Rugosimonospora africana]|uniref:DUF4012 domain-containing protein n=1 Tax=Rugosimonospora africana TaxID=556532 RepID=A0A8J3VTA5_9ACTN|nr:DUF4012 domain-containing protein [Rugosimonospora africana]GIH17995.1 hypothetical protein Raf01_61670 [Rugosimonospora africana]
MAAGPSVIYRSRRRRRRRQLRRALLAAAVAGSLVALGGGWLVVRGWEARGHLISAAGLASDLSEQVLAGETGQARRTLTALQDQAAGAHDITTGPAWWTASRTPYAGRDITAVRAIAASVDDLAARAFPALVQLNPSALVPTAGHLDLAALSTAAPKLAAADTVVQQVRTRLDGIPATGLLPPIRNAVNTLRSQIDRLSGLTSAGHRGTALLPALLGADGPRTYLLLLQNLAESRSTGGIFGAYAVVQADHGQLTMANRGAGGDLQQFAEPVLPLDAATRALYTDRIGTFPADVNLTPDFPTAAQTFREMYRQRNGVTVDGVLATDPVALSYLLRAIGPVTMPGQPTLEAGTVVRTLLSQPYRDIESDSDRHGYFASSVLAIFDAVMHRQSDPRAVLTALDQATTERRILFWSARADERDALAGTGLSGVLPEQETVPTVGVFLNDGSGSKLDYYLTHSATLSVGSCRPDGRRELNLRLTLGSTAPSSGLTPAVLGLGLAGDPYTARVIVYLFSPVSGSLVSARLDGTPAPLGSGAQKKRQVGVISVDLPPGRSHVLDVNLLTPAVPANTAKLWLTPGVAPWTTHINSAPACAQ